eukprot:TRINITY_DN1028_c0_g2_i1.p1 TRINITY_DN1028_c0_g2~~TRINITY_DN1028_c0_g2_i1.p1  ORF type:complete len:424 (+),score=168.63 TRINITY_DN1028_c0_g2_i1:79-1272(+)
MPRDAVLPGLGPLLYYLKRTRARLSGLIESGHPPDEETLRTKIMPSVVMTIKKFTGACPEEEHREAIRQLLLSKGCIDCSADLDGFSAALAELEDYVDGPDPEVEMHHADDGGDGGVDLSDIHAVIARLWEIDAGERLEPGEHIHLHAQARCRGFSDRCSVPLFERVDEDRFRAHSCSEPFIALLDNYVRDDDQAERMDAQERRELDTFLRALCASPQMQLAHKALHSWGLAPRSMQEFKSEIYELWFSPYSVHGRRGPLSSSGFEHVFVGEEKHDKRTGKSSVTGLHSWIQFWQEERKGRIDYMGFMGRAEDDSQVATVRFTWEDEDDGSEEVKPASTFLIGSTVAFEFALLTMVWLKLGGEGELKFDIGGLPVAVKCYKWATPLHTHIRTAYIDA